MAKVGGGGEVITEGRRGGQETEGNKYEKTMM